MTMWWGRLAAASLALITVASWQGRQAYAADAPAQPAVSGHVLVAADLHFDPLADPSLLLRLRAAPPAEWRAILESAPALSRPRADPAWPAISSAIAAMRARNPAPAVVLLPGDFLAHGLKERFKAALPPLRDPAAGPIDRPDPVLAEQAYREFVRAAMQFLAIQFRAAFPQTMIAPVLGNNDSLCGDYAQQPGGPFLQDMQPILHDLLNLDGRSGEVGTGFDDTWQAIGAYDVPVTGSDQLRLVVIDDSFLSRHYRNRCGTAASPDGAARTLDWLQQRLDHWARSNKRVWLVMHIPPGLDTYGTLHASAALTRACPTPVSMLDAAMEPRLTALLRRYRTTLAAGLTGHTHLDDFRLIDDGAGGTAGFFLINPGISPLFGQNPAFRDVSFGLDGTLLDQTTLIEQAGAWREEYSFRQSWGYPRIDAESLSSLSKRIQTDEAARRRWLGQFGTGKADYWQIEASRFAPTSSASIPSPLTVSAYRCAELTTDSAAWAHCTCQP